MADKLLIIGQDLFFATGNRAPMTLDGLTIEENNGNAPWSGVVVQGGGTASISGMQFTSNSNVQTAVSSQGPQASEIEVVDSRFTNNNGAGQVRY